MTDAADLGQRLSGRTIFMSASVPAPNRARRFRRIPDAAMEIEQAVISLARAVFAEGGKLVFGGHPSISPLVAMVAGEYRAAEGGTLPSARVVIYQSDLFKGRIARETLLMFRLGLAREVWTPRDPAEQFGSTPAVGPKYPRSLARMRRDMIEGSRPAAMVCIGGMEGVVREAQLFGSLFRGRPRFLLRRTGGAAALLSKCAPGGFQVIDDIIMAEMEDMDRDAEGPASAAAPGAESGEGTVPYPLIMQTIVDKVARLRGAGQGGRRG